MGNIICPECGGSMELQIAGGWGDYITFEICYRCKVLWRGYPWGEKQRETFKEHLKESK